MTKSYDFPSGGIHGYVSEYIRSLPDLADKIVLDVPCGDGRAAYEFVRKGAKVIALDLYPAFMKLDEVKAEYADLSDSLPVKSSTVDYIICQEGIEHIPNQLKVLEEFNRVLKKSGRLLITTPSYSHVRARLSHFLLETSSYKRMPPTEIDSVWFADKQSEKLYFGHLFPLNVQHFQTLSVISGFRLADRIRTNIGRTSLIFGLLFYPLFVCITLLGWIFYRKKNLHVSQKDKDRILWERLKLNLSSLTLFYKHIFWVLEKEMELGEVAEKLRGLSRE